MCGRYRLSRRKQLIQEYFDTCGPQKPLRVEMDVLQLFWVAGW